jgi:ferredoxin
MSDQSHSPKLARIEVDRDTCISAASCVALAPKTFALDDDGKVKLLDAKGDQDEMIIEAARSCPVDAIKVYDEEGTLVWPKPL